MPSSDILTHIGPAGSEKDRQHTVNPGVKVGTNFVKVVNTKHWSTQVDTQSSFSIKKKMVQKLQSNNKQYINVYIASLSTTLESTTFITVGCTQPIYNTRQTLPEEVGV